MTSIKHLPRKVSSLLFVAVIILVIKSEYVRFMISWNITFCVERNMRSDSWNLVKEGDRDELIGKSSTEESFSKVLLSLRCVGHWVLNL